MGSVPSTRKPPPRFLRRPKESSQTRVRPKSCWCVMPFPGPLCPCGFGSTHLTSDADWAFLGWRAGGVGLALHGAELARQHPCQGSHLWNSTRGQPGVRCSSRLEGLSSPLSSFAAPVAHRGTRAKVPDFVRINNEADLVPIVPGRFLGFQHPHGEIHIVSPGNAVACSGDDNADDSKCTIKTVPNILGGDIINHLGPYEGIFIGTIFCN